jgi:hypothetical protein
MRADSFAGGVIAAISRRTPAFRQPAAPDPARNFELLIPEDTAAACPECLEEVRAEDLLRTDWENGGAFPVTLGEFLDAVQGHQCWTED